MDYFKFPPECKTRKLRLNICGAVWCSVYILCSLNGHFVLLFYNPKLCLLGFVSTSSAARLLFDLRKVVMVHLFEGPVLQDTLMRMEGEKNPAPFRIRTHVLSVTRSGFYVCATTAAQFAHCLQFKPDKILLKIGKAKCERFDCLMQIKDTQSMFR